MNQYQGARVSLVLGSGGARGLAHIGIIHWLEEAGFVIESVSGASMGALVGGIYAAGKLDTYRDWVCALRQTDVLRFLDFSFRSGGLFKGDRIMETLRVMVGDHRIEDLPIEYTAVATDIDRQREVWLSKGPLFDAIRASIAVPTVFTPCEYKGLKLLDGGLLNPIPIAPTLRDMTDLTIAVNLNGEPCPSRQRQTTKVGVEVASEDGDLHTRILRFLDSLGTNFHVSSKHDLGLFELISRSFETMQNAIVAAKIATYAPDVLIEVPRNACGAHEFHRAKELIELGYQLAGAIVPNKVDR